MDVDELLCLELGVNVLRELRFAVHTCERREQALAACAEILHLVATGATHGHHPELDPWENAWRSFVVECERSDRLAEWLRLGLSLTTKPEATFYAAVMASFRPRDEYRWIPATDLPPPHNPFRCDHYEQFARALAKHERRARLKTVLTRKNPTNVDTQLAAGEDFRRWLKSTAAPPCSWHAHGTDWVDVVAWTKHAWDANETGWTSNSLNSWVEAHVPADARRGVRAMLWDPIVWSGAGSLLSNGQHRALALVGAGVPEVLVAATPGQRNVNHS